MEEKMTALWRLAFMLEMGENPEDGALFTICQKGQPRLLAALSGGALECRLQTDARDTPMLLCAPLPAGQAQVQLDWLHHRAELWVDGSLADEDWPLGECLGDVRQAQTEVHRPGVVFALGFAAPVARQRIAAGQPVDAHFFKPGAKGEKVYVGDCMPFDDDGVYRLFYLRDRRGHQSKWGFGAHEFAQISTTDLKQWTAQPMAIEITHQWEGSICTGSCIKKDGVYYMYYAARMSDGSPARLSWATSTDGVHFTKTDRSFSLQSPYEPVSARDPKVFMDDEGLYHMLLTSSIKDYPIPQLDGCLAHLTSPDLENWTQQPPFMVPGYPEQPECADYFSWNGYHYLVFSNSCVAKYRYAKSPFGPWLRPAIEQIDGDCYRVPKVAPFAGGRYIMAGFLPLDKEGKRYGGNLLLREVRQKPNGELAFAFVRELQPQPQGEAQSHTLAPNAIYCYQYTEKQQLQSGRMRVVFRPGQGVSVCGLTFGTPGGAAVELCFDLDTMTAALYPAYAHLSEKKLGNRIRFLPQQGGSISCELVYAQGIMDICVNDEATLAQRLGGEEEGELRDVRFYCRDGSCTLEVTAGA